ncbi:hypothetical protein [Bifidobacterium simiarum]|uniref:FtsK domain-containing protein n=1 Tax=Bifidobacterium simiarum TaxID=2045441 RepID=A0A2M9HEY6_9BIFI|nr:hypothetical protein [Bifidobacterium simiarum]PJM75365.1 hypothetical protein CSQ87_04950 [Bifidobacterium simiarum]
MNAETDKEVSVRADISTLVTGLTGSGKGSISANWLKAQAPYIMRGLVWVAYVDLKNGMEGGMVDARLIHRHAWNMDEALELLSDLNDEVWRRTGAVRGKLRNIPPSEQYPRLLLVIDEAAELVTSVAKSRRKQTDEAVELLDSMMRVGRAAGLVVLAMTQDPRVQAMPLRARFPQRIALRLTDESEAQMALSPHAVELGATPWQIPVSEPGTAWIWNIETDTVQRVRAPYIDDDELRNLAEPYA